MFGTHVHQKMIFLDKLLINFYYEFIHNDYDAIRFHFPHAASIVPHMWHNSFILAPCPIYYLVRLL